MTEGMTVTTFVGEREGQRFDITVEIGVPYQCGTYPAEWACTIALKGLHGKLPDVRAGDAFQALCLSARLALTLLDGFKSEGGKLLFQTGEEVPLEAYGLPPWKYG